MELADLKAPRPPLPRLKEGDKKVNAILRDLELIRNTKPKKRFKKCETLIHFIVHTLRKSKSDHLLYTTSVWALVSLFRLFPENAKEIMVEAGVPGILHDIMKPGAVTGSTRQYMSELCFYLSSNQTYPDEASLPLTAGPMQNLPEVNPINSYQDLLDDISVYSDMSSEVNEKGKQPFIPYRISKENAYKLDSLFKTGYEHQLASGLPDRSFISKYGFSDREKVKTEDMDGNVEDSDSSDEECDDNSVNSSISSRSQVFGYHTHISSVPSTIPTHRINPNRLNYPSFPLHEIPSGLTSSQGLGKYPSTAPNSILVDRLDPLGSSNVKEDDDEDHWSSDDEKEYEDYFPSPTRYRAKTVSFDRTRSTHFRLGGHALQTTLKKVTNGTDGASLDSGQSSHEFYPDTIATDEDSHVLFPYASGLNPHLAETSWQTNSLIKSSNSIPGTGQQTLTQPIPQAHDPYQHFVSPGRIRPRTLGNDLGSYVSHSSKRSRTSKSSGRLSRTALAAIEKYPTFKEYAYGALGKEEEEVVSPVRHRMKYRSENDAESDNKSTGSLHEHLEEGGVSEFLAKLDPLSANLDFPLKGKKYQNASFTSEIEMEKDEDGFFILSDNEEDSEEDSDGEDIFDYDALTFASTEDAPTNKYLLKKKQRIRAEKLIDHRFMRKLFRKRAKISDIQDLIKRMESMFLLMDEKNTGFVTWESFARIILALAPAKLLRGDVLSFMEAQTDNVQDLVDYREFIISGKVMLVASLNDDHKNLPVTGWLNRQKLYVKESSTYTWKNHVRWYQKRQAVAVVWLMRRAQRSLNYSVYLLQAEADLMKYRKRAMDLTWLLEAAHDAKIAQDQHFVAKKNLLKRAVHARLWTQKVDNAQKFLAATAKAELMYYYYAEKAKEEKLAEILEQEKEKEEEKARKPQVKYSQMYRVYELSKLAIEFLQNRAKRALKHSKKQDQIVRWLTKKAIKTQNLLDAQVVCSTWLRHAGERANHHVTLQEEALKGLMRIGAGGFSFLTRQMLNLNWMQQRGARALVFWGEMEAAAEWLVAKGQRTLVWMNKREAAFNFLHERCQRRVRLLHAKREALIYLRKLPVGVWDAEMLRQKNWAALKNIGDAAKAHCVKQYKAFQWLLFMAGRATKVQRRARLAYTDLQQIGQRAKVLRFAQLCGTSLGGLADPPAEENLRTRKLENLDKENKNKNVNVQYERRLKQERKKIADDEKNRNKVQSQTVRTIRKEERQSRRQNSPSRFSTRLSRSPDRATSGLGDTSSIPGSPPRTAGFGSPPKNPYSTRGSPPGTAASGFGSPTKNLFSTVGSPSRPGTSGSVGGFVPGSTRQVHEKNWLRVVMREVFEWVAASFTPPKEQQGEKFLGRVGFQRLMLDGKLLGFAPGCTDDLFRTLDPADSCFISFETFWSWFSFLLQSKQKQINRSIVKKGEKLQISHIMSVDERAVISLMNKVYFEFDLAQLDLKKKKKKKKGFLFDSSDDEEEEDEENEGDEDNSDFDNNDHVDIRNIGKLMKYLTRKKDTTRNSERLNIAEQATGTFIDPLEEGKKESLAIEGEGEKDKSMGFESSEKYVLTKNIEKLNNGEGETNDPKLS